MEPAKKESLQQLLSKARLLEEKLGKNWLTHFSPAKSPEELQQRTAQHGVWLTPEEALQGFSLMQDPSESELSDEELAKLSGGAFLGVVPK
ncbi:MAG TPA: hypothetical protein P5560_01100 [Thermotogota bacterium]|nr:hypothetical protein [Thermotogota bacterium]HRW91525.1 hypothetical protein [Thermotogota bacterium]